MEKTDSPKKDSVSKSWFAVFNNPENHGYFGNPEEICEQLKSEWIADSSTRSGAWCYCVSADGLHHIHMVLEDKKAMRWSAIKKTYAVGMHFKATRGTKEQAEDYIYKRGVFEEKGEEVLYTCVFGEIKGKQGQRTDISVIYDLIKSGCSDFEILEIEPGCMKYLDKISACREIIRYEEFKNKRRLDMRVEYWYGVPGSGKTSGVLNLYGDANVYIISDYQHPWDNYKGQDIVLFDDFDYTKIDIQQLLRWLDVYPLQLPCRYNNKTACYTKVFFTSNLAFDAMYMYVQRETPLIWEAFCRRFHLLKEFKKDGIRTEYTVDQYLNRWRVSRDFQKVSKEAEQEILDLFGDGTPGHAHP